MVYQDNTPRLTCWSNLMTLGWIICGKLLGCVACKTKLGNQGQKGNFYESIWLRRQILFWRKSWIQPGEGYRCILDLRESFHAETFFNMLILKLSDSGTLRRKLPLAQLFFGTKNIRSPQFLYSIRRRADARNLSISLYQHNWLNQIIV